MIKCVKGTRDILPEEIYAWHFIEEICRIYFHRYGFEEIRTPIFEVTDLFARSIGNTTDIVEKEMYTFEDRNGLSLTLRPEGTASVVRAYIQHSMYHQSSMTKVYYMGPMFRYERPQKGRYRQFYQIGVEVFGPQSSAVEAEVLVMLIQILDTLGIEPVDLWINSIGCPICRPGFLDILREKEKENASLLCHDCRKRIERNPLRVLDCKNDQCQEVIARLPRITDYLCDDCSHHHQTLKKYLKNLNVPYKENPRLVRGLDYYVRTTFEITSSALGAQNSLLGGGRYDGLVEELGGPPTHGFGFALGLDRFVLALPSDVKLKAKKRPDLYIAYLGEKAFEKSLLIASSLRKDGIRVFLDFEKRSLKSHMRLANRIFSSSVVIIGDQEIKKNEVVFKDMATGKQENIVIDKLNEYLIKRKSSEVLL